MVSFLWQAAGIHKIIPNMKIDDYLFEPCGYSMNAICNGIQEVTDNSVRSKVP